MPQMSPMWWTTLMIFFVMMLFTCMYMMYFNYKMNMKKSESETFKELNWTW